MCRGKQRSRSGELVESWRMSDLTAHEPEVFVVVIVGDDEHDILLFGCLCQGD